MPNKLRNQNSRKIIGRGKELEPVMGISPMRGLMDKVDKKSKERFSNQGFSNAYPRINKDRVSNPKPQGGNGGDSYVNKLECANYGKKYDGKCLAGTGDCSGCGKSGHQLRNFPTLLAKGK